LSSLKELQKLIPDKSYRVFHYMNTRQ